MFPFKSKLNYLFVMIGAVLHCVVSDEDDEEADAGAVTSRQTTIEVKVPHDAVGAVTGVQGAQIKMVRIQSSQKRFVL